MSSKTSTLLENQALLQKSGKLKSKKTLLYPIVHVSALELQASSRYADDTHTHTHTHTNTHRQTDTQTDYHMSSLAHAHRGIITTVSLNEGNVVKGEEN